MSRGACIRDNDPNPSRVMPSIIAKDIDNIAPMAAPILYTIKAGDGRFWLDGETYPWTSKIEDAYRWAYRSIPDGIVERWNKQNDVVLGGVTIVNKKDNIYLCEVVEI